MISMNIEWYTCNCGWNVRNDFKREIIFKLIWEGQESICWAKTKKKGHAESGKNKYKCTVVLKDFKIF